MGHCLATVDSHLFVGRVATQFYGAAEFNNKTKEGPITTTKKVVLVPASQVRRDKQEAQPLTPSTTAPATYQVGEAAQRVLYNHSYPSAVAFYD